MNPAGSGSSGAPFASPATRNRPSPPGSISRITAADVDDFAARFGRALATLTSDHSSTESDLLP